jgi:hypothetical protein
VTSIENGRYSRNSATIAGVIMVALVNSVTMKPRRLAWR